MMLIPVIMCGGAGTRLWPVSRELMPKPFMCLGHQPSLIRQTLHRASALPGVKEVLSLANRDLYFLLRDEYAAWQCDQKMEQDGKALQLGYLLEPQGRNTAPAVALAAAEVLERHGSEAIMLILAADHVVRDGEAFADAVEKAVVTAQMGRIVTFGITPTYPETGFGYIRKNEAQPLGEGGWEVAQFVEKPDREIAATYLADPRYSWNSGMFCVQAGVLLEEMRIHCPEIVAEVARARGAARYAEISDGSWCAEYEPTTFSRFPDVSIDVALLEKTSRAAVVPCSIGWGDIGSWAAVAAESVPDADGNVIEGGAYLHDVHDCYLSTQAERVVAAVGVSNLVIVDTPDALLVAERGRTQEVREIVRKLKKDAHPTYRFPRTVHRPWGTYTVLEEAERFKIKRLVVKPGGCLSLQRHHHRSEHWVVVAGMAEVTNGERTFFVQANESTYIPAGCLHRLRNPGMLDLVMIEVQCGEYVGEDDIVRISDEYGRQETGAAGSEAPMIAGLDQATGLKRL